MTSTLGNLIAFSIASTVVTLLPGPDFLLLLRNALRGGWRSGLGTATGTATGLAAWSVAAALGLSSLLEASKVAYDVLRFVGAAYLVWLGVTTLCRRAASSGATVAVVPDRTGFKRCFASGLISDLCNPKVGIFYVAFLPAFIPTGADTRATTFGLGLANSLETYLYFLLVVWLVSRGKTWLTSSRLHRRVEQLTGVVLVGFGLRLATEARA